MTASFLTFAATFVLAAFMVLWGLANLDAQLAAEALDRQESFYSIRGIN